MSKSSALLAAVLLCGAFAVQAQDDASRAKADEAAKPPEDAKPAATATPDAKPGATDEVLPPEDAPSYGETVVVTASRHEQQILEAPVSISVIGADVLETTPADNFADLLRGTPGLNVIQTSARDINVLARGATATLETGQLALVDGRSIYQDFYGFVMWDGLPFAFDEIEQVEILRGPGSALWGANALNGVVNVRTKSPRELQGGAFRIGAGERGTRSTYVRWADAREKLSYKVSASWFQQDAWPRSTKLPDGRPLPPTVSFANVGTKQPKLDLRVDWEPAPGKRWSYQLGGSGTSGIIHTGVGPYSVDDGTRNAYAEVSYQGPALDAKIYSNVLDGDAINLLSRQPLIFDTKLYVADIVGKKLVGGRHLWTYGGNVRLNRFDISDLPTASARDEYGVHAEDQISLGRKVLLTLGVRFDEFDTVGSTLSPRTALVVMPRKGHSIRFAFNHAFRSPSLVNEFLDVPTTLAAVVPINGTPTLVVYGGRAVGNAAIEHERVDAYEIGYTGLLGKTTFTAAIYRNDTEGSIDFYPAEFYSPADPPPGWAHDPSQVPLFALVKKFTYRNIGQTRDRGFELSANVPYARGVTGNFSYAYQDRPKVTDSSNSPIPIDTNVPPTHHFATGVHVLRGPWRGALDVSYTGEARWSDVLNFVGETEDYWLANGAVGYQFAKGKLEVGLDVTNILDEDAQQHVFADVIGRRAMLELRTKW